MRQVFNLVGDDMDDKAFFLHAAPYAEQARGENGAPVLFKNFRPDNDIGNAGFVFERCKDNAARGAGALPHQHKTGKLNARTMLDLVVQLTVRDDTPRGEAVAQKRHGMGLQRQTQCRIIEHDMFAERHGWQRRLRLMLKAAFLMRGKERQGGRHFAVLPAAITAEPAHGPKRGAPVKADGAERVCIGQLFDEARAELCPQPEVAQ